MYPIYTVIVPVNRNFQNLIIILVNCNMATEIVTGMREETARELERLRREVLMAKQELQHRFDSYYRVLQDKQSEMEARLDEVVRVSETQMMDRQTQLNQLKITKADVSQDLVHNKLNETLVDLSLVIDEKIQGLEAIVDQVPSVWLEWRDEWLVGGMEELCRICEEVSYVNRHNPVCSGVNGGEGQNEIHSPRGLSTDRHNGDVYVCDCKTDRIQVFSREGIHQKIISPQGLFYPFHLTVTPHHLFVCCYLPCCIYKLDKLSGSILCSVITEDNISGLSADTDTLYAGMFEYNQISHLSLEDLTTIRVTSLNSPHITQGTKLQDLKIAPSLFIVLFHDCTNPIQTFSRDGNLIQVIASQDQLMDAWCLCVDRHLNIIVSDYGAHNLKVFSIEGHLLTTIGQKGEGPGKFNGLVGINVDKEGRIVVVDCKQSHMLQFF